MRRLILDRPGVLRCGEYEAGKVYEIEDDDEAQRLVEAKGFRDATDEPAKPAPPAPEE